MKLMSWSFLLSLDDIFGSSSNQQSSTRGHSTTSVSFDQVRKQIVVMITIFAHGCYVTSMSVGGNLMALDHSFTHSLTHSLDSD